MYLPMLVACITILFTIFYLWAKYKLSYWQRLGIPTLPTNIFFGNFKESILLRISPGQLLGRLHNEANDNWPYLGIYIMHKPFLLLRDPKLMKQILIRDFNIFSNRNFSSQNKHDRLGVDNLFVLKNPEWKYLRTKLSPIFTTGKLKQLFGLMVESSDFLKNYLDNIFNNDLNLIKLIEVKEMCNKYTTDIISSLAFGVSTNSFDDPTPEFYIYSRIPFIMTARRTLQLFITFFFPNLSDLFNNSFPGVYTDYFRKIFWSSMKARESSNVERGDVIDSLLKLKNEKQESTFKMVGDSLVAQSVIFFIAGLETSAVTMSFAMWELAVKPELQTRVRSEIHECLKYNDLSYESIMNMKYLMQVINETLRLYPTAPIIDRVASEDYKIPGSDIVIKEGTVVYMSLPGIQRDPKYFLNPNEFDPDRFSDEEKIKMEPCTYMPFGEGPRTCIGMRLGLIQTAIGLVRILNDYELSINPKYQPKMSSRNIFLAPEDGVYLLLKKIVV